MSAHIISVNSRVAGAGKTLLSAAICRWIRREHHAVCPFSAPGTGKPALRSLQVLARSADLLESLAPSGGVDELAAILDQWRYVVVDCGPGFEPPAGARFELRNASGSGIEILDVVSGEILKAPWYNASTLFPEVPTAVAQLPEWSFANAPRVGICSLPNLRNFADFRLFNGSEWLTSPPAGLFQFLIVPASRDAAFDRAWLAEVGLDAWLERQRAQGCRVICTASTLVKGEPVEEGELQDFRTVSLLLGRRLPPPDPDDSALDALAVWLEKVAGARRLRERCLGS
jgi:hypothetical protein